MVSRQRASPKGDFVKVHAAPVMTVNHHFTGVKQNQVRRPSCSIGSSNVG